MTEVKTNHGESETFMVKMWVHQGSVLSPLLFVAVIEALICEVWLLWELLYVDGLVLVAESMGELKKRVSRLKECMEANRLIIFD